jgi:hypothetical protein
MAGPAPAAAEAALGAAATAAMAPIVSRIQGKSRYARI